MPVAPVTWPSFRVGNRNNINLIRTFRVDNGERIVAKDGASVTRVGASEDGRRADDLRKKRIKLAHESVRRRGTSVPVPIDGRGSFLHCEFVKLDVQAGR